MAKFKFRLATLLQIRERARDERRAQLAQAYKAEQILQEREDQVMRELAELDKRRRGASGPGPVDVDRLMETQRHHLILKAQRQHTRNQRALVEAEIRRRRDAVVHANGEVRVLEKLREKQLLRHRREEIRQEIKNLDEMAQQRAAREGVL